MNNQSQTYPFSLLSTLDQEKLTTSFSFEKVKKATVILEQEITRVEKFYILSTGHARYYYELNHTNLLTGELLAGDNFGGLSILLNNAISIRSLKVVEDSIFATIGADFFLNLCTENIEFQDYFTNTFGKCMLNKSFAGIISRQIKGQGI